MANSYFDCCTSGVPILAAAKIRRSPAEECYVGEKPLCNCGRKQILGILLRDFLALEGMTQHVDSSV